MSFNKVLIANRGEIAVRLIRACHALNLKAVAVFSDADENALHVAMADEAVHIGAAEARASYLGGQKIIEAAQATGAGAIHPGYGFLAENADFAQACADAGLVFVGPSPRAIAAMGAKIEAKRIAEQAAVHCVPGYHGDDQGDETLLAEAERIGTPLLIKASAGGGGRGMRLIHDLQDFSNQLALARSEAEAAFGNPAVLLEKYVEAPRHIEVQILADSHGNVRHLFERDCSVQRNYQKIIEEAPAPNLTAELRQQILDDAIKLAEAIGYDNAGTVEFVVDAANNAAYFLEMNTRLQVEHPVTEMITGIDLAAWQLRIAAGEAIDFAQNEVQINGWAMEARIAAEDPAESYQPQTGLITAYREPGGTGIRVDSGVVAGSEVTPFYDSMLAKLICHARSRADAIRGLQAALADYRITGPGVNTAFLHDVLALPPFLEGKHLTGLLADTWPDGWQPAEMSGQDLAHAALARQLQAEATEASSAWKALGSWRLGEHIGYPANTTWYLRCGDAETRSLQVIGRGGNYRIYEAEEELLQVQNGRLQGEKLCYRSNNRQQQLSVAIDGRQVSLQVDARTISIEVLQPEDVLLGEGEEAAALGNQVLAPTPGLVAEVQVTPGDAVTAGQPLVVLEAMKLFQELVAPRDSVVDQVHCVAGDSVNSGDVLVSFTSENEQSQKAVNQ